MLEKIEKQEIVKYDPKMIIQQNTLPGNFRKINTLELAIKDKSDSLASIKRKVGEKVSLSILKVWIINLNDFLNIPRKMTPPQIEETAMMVFDEFYYLKISDISLIFKRIKIGHYGNLYESIDGMKIIGMFHQYAKERIDYHVSKSTRDHKKYI